MASDSLAKFSGLLRYQLYECNDQQISLDKEITYLRNFIELEKLRQNNNIEVIFEVEQPGTEYLGIAPFILMTFVENAFKHGANPSLAKSFIHIDYILDSEHNHLTFSISNTKPSILNELDKAKVGGIGLKNVQTRLNILYPSRHELKIVDETDKYTVTLTLQTI